MNEMPWLEEMILAVPWWGFGLTGLAAVGFGALQVLLMRRATRGGTPKPWLFAVKFLLWAVALVTMGFISIPLLVLFALIGTVILLCGTAMAYHRAQREEI